MKQSEMKTVVIRVPPDVLAELEIAGKHLNRKLGPTCFELIKVGLDNYRATPRRSDETPYQKARVVGGDDPIQNALIDIQERLAKLERKTD